MIFVCDVCGSASQVPLRDNDCHAHLARDHLSQHAAAREKFARVFRMQMYSTQSRVQVVHLSARQACVTSLNTIFRTWVHITCQFVVYFVKPLRTIWRYHIKNFLICTTVFKCYNYRFWSSHSLKLNPNLNLKLIFYIYVVKLMTFL